MLQLVAVAALLVSSLFPIVHAARFREVNTFRGKGFYEGFKFEAIPDPTHGRVNYVDRETAVARNLTYADRDTFILRADSNKRLSRDGPGRDSIRMLSNRQWTNGVMVFNIRHMPVGCGTWPAVWTNGDTWPTTGEIDILEGVNDQGPNQMTLHTDEGCKVPSRREQSGTSLTNDCNVHVTNNIGCGVKDRDDRSFGRSFNDNGGGWFAMERTSAHIKVWFWSRSGYVPRDVARGSDRIDTKGPSWGRPVAYFPNWSCDIDDHFGPQNIIINLTFCGDWGGSVYGKSGCPGSCVDYVNNNPEAFREAYFDIAWVKVYE